MKSNVTLEQLQLMQHIDCNVAILLYDRSVVRDGNIQIFITNDSLNKWLAENSDYVKENKITYYGDRLGKAIDYVIQNDSTQGLIIDGLTPVSLYITHEDLQPIKDFVDSFCIMYACVCNNISNEKAAKLMTNIQIFFLGNMPTLKKDTKFGIETFKRNKNGEEYESIKIFLTEEQAQKYNANKLPVSKCRLSDLARFYKGMFNFIIEPHCNYWVEFTTEEIL
jgi:exo-beta-1,3-glucanase (GH17 family)